MRRPATRTAPASMVEAVTAEERLFPATPRVVYRQSPLLDVICQVRFPPVLRIESEAPASFQEAIRSKFPLVERRATGVEIAGLPVELSRLVAMSGQQTIQYDFRSEDGNHTLTLVPDFLALTSKSYGRWEDFTALLAPALTALENVYKPSFYTRIGLRYRNQIEPEKLGLSAAPWSNLLSKNVLGELVGSDVDGVVFSEAYRHLRLHFADSKVSVYLQHGLGTAIGGGRAPYVVDVDVYTEQKTEVANEYSQLHQLHALAGRVFRWCVSDRLHEALGPNPVAGDVARR